MVHTIKGQTPKIHESVFVAWNAEITGNVTIDENASIWFSASIRGDMNSVTIGKGSNVQDNCVIHTDSNRGAVIGDNVTVGHGAIRGHGSHRAGRSQGGGKLHGGSRLRGSPRKGIPRWQHDYGLSCQGSEGNAAGGNRGLCQELPVLRGNGAAVPGGVQVKEKGWLKGHPC